MIYPKKNKLRVRSLVEITICGKLYNKAEVKMEAVELSCHNNLNKICISVILQFTELKQVTMHIRQTNKQTNNNC